MKNNILRKVSLFLLAGCLIVMAGCGNSNPAESPSSSAERPADTEAPEKPACEVLTVGSGTLGGGSGSAGDISEYSSISADPSRLGERKTLELCGKVYELEYRETVHYTIGCFDADKYEIITIDGKTPPRKSVTLFPSVFLYPDGSILRIHGVDIADLGLNGELSKESITEALIEIFADVIDLGAYSYERLDRFEDAQDPNYYVSFCTDKSGIMLGNSASFIITEDGVVSQLHFSNKVSIDTSAIPEDFNIADYSDVIETKLKELYGEEMDAWRVDELSRWTTVNEKTCLLLRVEIDLAFESGVYSDARDIALCFGE